MTTNINSYASMKDRGTVATSVSFRGLPKAIEIKSSTVSSALQKINKHVSSPEQRLIMGVTALFSQPFIDLNNKRVNEETRLMSFARTLSKIVIGTTVGVLVRKECIRLAHKYTKMKAIPKINGSGYYGVPAEKNSWLSPPHVRTYNKDYHKNYINALGSTMGIAVSLVTNFLIDAPLTQIMTNKTYNYLNRDNNSDKKHSNNLLENFLHSHKSSHKVSFSGLSPSKVGEICNVEWKGFDKLKHIFWTKVTSNPGEILMHTGALGWAAGSAAQITGIAFNDKIDSNKKKFLIPQEFADALGNIGLYYVVTLSIKNFVESMFDNGRIRIKSVMDAIRADIEKDPKLVKADLDKIFSKPNGKKVSDLLMNKDTKSLYLAHKNGASILATLVASVISCNILTPYFRNFYGAMCMDLAKKRSAEINAKLFEQSMQPSKMIVGDSDKSSAFAKFII